MKLKQLLNQILDVVIVVTFLLAMAVTVTGLSRVARPRTPDIYFIV